jgi:hypothetical protein
VTDRAAALRSLRSDRTEGLPPPPALVPAPPSPPTNDSEPPARDVTPSEPAPVEPQAGRAHSGSAGSQYPASLNALLADPVKACRDMGHLRENLPARPLNVDLTPAVAAAFDEQCRALRVKKKDVVELLLRGWLEHQGRDLD